MLDKTSNMVLKTLNKLSEGSSYKVVTCDDIIACLNKNKFDVDGIKQIMDFLEKHEYINIKFSEDNTYCYSLLPKARIYLEQNGSKSKPKFRQFSILTYVFIAISSFIGSLLALFIFFYLNT